MLFTSLSPDPTDLYNVLGNAPLLLVSPKQRRAMYLSDLIIEVDVFMVLYIGCLPHNTFQGQPIRLQSESKKRLTSFLLRFLSVGRSFSRNLNPYCIIFAVCSPFQLTSITSFFLCHFFRDSSFASRKVASTGFHSAISDNTIIRDQTSWNQRNWPA